MHKEAFKKIFTGAVQGLSVEVEDFGVSKFEEDADQIKIATAMKNILLAESGMTVRGRFMVGDMYNHLTKDKAARKALMSMFVNVIGPNTAQRLRTYGWVASKWPIEARNDKHPWFWWMSNKPGEEEKVRAVSATKLEFVREEVIGGKVFKYYESGSGRAFVIEEKPAYVEREDGMGLLSYLNEDRPEYSVSVG